jgi:thiamine-phosphate pyrophosphorylase
VSWRVVVVTDRRRFASEEISGRVARILATVPQGAVAIQVREKDLDGGPLLALVREVIEVARPAGAEVWVNDRIDVALAAGADGVHLPERSLSVAEARALGVKRVGISRHGSFDDTGADVVQLGPIWDTPGKGPPLGVAALAVKTRAKLVAVGGIDRPERARAATDAGADAVAVIRAAWTTSDPGAAIAELVAAMK